MVLTILWMAGSLAFTDVAVDWVEEELPSAQEVARSFESDIERVAAMNVLARDVRQFSGFYRVSPHQCLKCEQYKEFAHSLEEKRCQKRKSKSKRCKEFLRGVADLDYPASFFGANVKRRFAPLVLAVETLVRVRNEEAPPRFDADTIPSETLNISEVARYALATLIVFAIAWLAARWPSTFLPILAFVIAASLVVAFIILYAYIIAYLVAVIMALSPLNGIGKTSKSE